jgi:hypothetical protein
MDSGGNLMTKARDLANGATALSAVSATELAYLDGVTSAVQTQIDGKQAVNAAVSTTELGYLDGVTSAIQTQLDAKTAKSTLTTTGDIYYASAANTPARLGIGSTDQVLKVTGGIPAWATPAGGGGMTSIASGTFTATATLDLTSISGSYKDLQFVARNIEPVPDTTLRLRFNNLSTSIYNGITITNINGTAATADYIAEAQFLLTAATAQRPMGGPLIFTVYDYANTTSFKNVTVEFTHFNNGGQTCQMWLSGTIRTNDALDRLTLSLGSGNFAAAGTYTLYGVN